MLYLLYVLVSSLVGVPRALNMRSPRAQVEFAEDDSHVLETGFKRRRKGKRDRSARQKRRYTSAEELIQEYDVQMWEFSRWWLAPRWFT
ncbi:hypothetical protein M758_UG017700 [Ceratodon purpureus]|nr:hypothetical protein M758_UG017700 [Ceratodon purpureus]